MKLRERLDAACHWLLASPSGPAVASLFGRLYAVVLAIAWLSLGSQIRVLIGRQGLLPVAALIEQPGFRDAAGWLGFPSLLRWPALAGDGVLVGGTWLGVALAVAALLGLYPRVAFALSAALYLSYATACRSFLSFQWDNLLLECALLASVLPWRRPAPVVHLLFRLLVFKLYFESGLAKWESSLSDWHDGSAMTFYYQTAPLPTRLAFYAHHLPVWWHHLESRATLALELVVPLFIFGPRRGRLIAAGILTGFQIVNVATANYGFFCYLAVALHVFLLDEQDVSGLRARLLGRLPPALAARLARTSEPAPVPRWQRWPPGLRRMLVAVPVLLYIGISLLEALEAFGPRGGWTAPFQPLERLYAPFRLVNTYHLFAAITRERIEPQIEIRTRDADGDGWQEYDLRYKPGAPGRAPPLVAPHQPRVDFLLWFHGLSWDRTPAYLVTLLDRICTDPASVQALFARNLPDHAQAVRVSYHRYRFASLGERRAKGLWWSRSLEGATSDITCATQL